MPKHNVSRIKIHEILSQAVPALLAIPRFTRKRYLNELENRRYSGRPLTDEEEQVRRVLQAIEWLGTDRANRSDKARE